MGRLTTHILDTAKGKPAAGVTVRLYGQGPERELRCTTTTNRDGRTDSPLLDGEDLTSGTYELEFDVGSYFSGDEETVGQTPFLGTVVIRVTLDADENYHVPLLVSPWSYSTYRGS